MSFNWYSVTKEQALDAIKSDALAKITEVSEWSDEHESLALGFIAGVCELANSLIDKINPPEEPASNV